MPQERLRVRHRREHAGDGIGHGEAVFGRRATGRQPRGHHLEGRAPLEHVLGREVVQRREQPERLAVEHRRPVLDEGPRAAAGTEHAYGLEGLERGTDTGPADAEFGGHFALGGQAVPRPEVALLNQPVQVARDPFPDGNGRVGCEPAVRSDHWCHEDVPRQ